MAERILTYLLLLLVPFQLYSQKSNTKFEPAPNIIINKLDMQNGISSSINDIYLDKNENLWIAQVNQSLLRYNGNTLEKKQVYKEFKNILPISSFVITKEKELKFAAEKFQFLLQIDKTDSLNIYKELEEEESFLYYSFYIDKKMTQEFLERNLEQKMTVPKIKSLISSLKFVVLDYNLFLYKLSDSIYLYNGKKSTKITQLLHDKQNLGNLFIYKGNIIEYYKNSFFLIDINNPSSRSIKIDKLIQSNLNASTTNNKTNPKIRSFSSQNLFTINKDNLFELTSFNNDSLGIKFICSLNFIEADITQILQNSRDGNIFISTYFEGIYILKENQFYYPFNKEYSRVNKRKVFFPMLLTSDNSIFNLWGVLNPKTSYSKIIDENAEGEYATIMGPDQTYWASHATNNILHFDSKFNKIKKYSYGTEKDKIYHLSLNENKEIIVLSGRTIGKLLEDSFHVLKDFRDLLPYDVVFNKIVYIKNGIYTICSNNGLYNYDVKNDKLLKESIFPETYVFDVIPTKKKNEYIILGHNSNHMYYKHENTFFYIPLPKNSGLQNIASALIDNNNKIWFATDNGLYVTTIGELNDYCEKKSNNIFFFSYNIQDGLGSTEFNGGLHESAVLTKDGYIGLCSLKGLLLFKENEVKQVFPVNQISFKSIKIKDSTFNGEDTIIGKGLSSNINFSVTTPYFGNPDNLLIEYSIGNLKNQVWKKVEKNEFNISGLKIGTTPIYIRLKTGFGSESYNYATIVIINQPFFYQSLPFIVFSCIAFLLLFLFFVYTVRKSAIRKRIINISKEKISAQNIQLEKKTQLLESTVKQLESAIEEVNDSKYKLNETIQLKEKLISLIIHDLKSPLYSQSILLNHLLSTNQSQNNNLSPIISDLKASNNAILKFTKDFLLWFSLQENGFSINYSSFAIHNLIDEISTLYLEISKQKNIPIINGIPPTLMVTSDRILLEIILRNIIDNALKYTENGKIAITASEDADIIDIVVTDTGIGINKEILSIINTPNNEKELSSFGYRFIQTLSLKINAIIDIQQNLPNGTIVMVRIPKYPTETIQQTT